MSNHSEQSCLIGSSELLQVAISATAPSVIRKGFGVRPSLRESIHLPRFAQQTASPLVLCTLALVMSHTRISRSDSLRFLGDDFSVLPDVDRRAVHARGLSGDPGRAP
jgi:hypothetical protein